MDWKGRKTNKTKQTEGQTDTQKKTRTKSDLENRGGTRERKKAQRILERQNITGNTYFPKMYVEVLPIFQLFYKVLSLTIFLGAQLLHELVCSSLS